ncbi:MAG: cell division protein FtsA [Bacteriovoracaceae bacterium]
MSTPKNAYSDFSDGNIPRNNSRQLIAKQLAVGLDVGTTKVCTIVGCVNGPEVEIIGIGNHPSLGLKKGSVVNIDNTVRSIKASLEEARLMAGVDIESATIGIAGSHIYSFNSSGAIPIRGTEVDEEDVRRVLEAAKAVVVPSDRQILHVLPQEFRVDNTPDIKNPIGMSGVRLEVDVHIVTGSIPLIQNLVKCVELAGVHVDQITLQPLASSLAVLSDEERDMGTVLVDIGGGTTDIAIWKDGDLVHSQIIPVGGNHFTSDLAVALKTTHQEAERIKENHGQLFTSQNMSENNIRINGINGTKPRNIGPEIIAEVLYARGEELFNIVNKIILDNVEFTDINGGIVLTGGGALINGTQELGEYIIGMPVKLGYPQSFGGMTNIMQNPKYATVLGLLLESKQIKENGGSYASGDKIDLFSKISDSITSIFKEIF